MNSDNVYHLPVGRAKDEHSRQGRTSNPSDPIQMALPFNAPRLLVFTLTSDFDVAGLFDRFAQAVGPTVVIDMRMSPRLEFIGTTRSKTFEYFKSMQIDYKDIFGKVGVNGYADAEGKKTALGMAVAETLDTAKSSDGTALFFFDDPDFMNRCRRFLEPSFDILDMDGTAIERKALESSLLQM